MRHNVITKEAAKTIFHKVESSSVPIAIFAQYGSWTATKVNSQNFARQVQRTPELMVGIFDINTRLDWLEDDLAAAGIR